MNILPKLVLCSLLPVASVPPPTAPRYESAPVYIHSGMTGVLVRYGTFRYEARDDAFVIYCISPAVKAVIIQCVALMPGDRLVLVEAQATEHRT